MSRLATLTSPRTLLAGYVLFRVGSVGLLLVLFGLEAMLDLLWTPRWAAMTLGVPTLVGLVGVSVRTDLPWR